MHHSVEDGSEYLGDGPLHDSISHGRDVQLPGVVLAFWDMDREEGRGVVVVGVQLFGDCFDPGPGCLCEPFGRFGEVAIIEIIGDDCRPGALHVHRISNLSKERCFVRGV